MTFIRYTLIILILLLCIVYGSYVYFEWGSAKEFQKDVDWLFWACVKILQDWGRWTGLGYNLLNIIIFIILQPLLILIFFVLWRIEVSKRKRLKRRTAASRRRSSPCGRGHCDGHRRCPQQREPADGPFEHQSPPKGTFSPISSPPGGRFF